MEESIIAQATSFFRQLGDLQVNNTPDGMETDWIKLLSSVIVQDVFSSIQSLTGDFEGKWRSLNSRISDMTLKIDKEFEGHHRRIITTEQDLRSVRDTTVRQRDNIDENFHLIEVLKDEVALRATIDSVEDINFAVLKCASKREVADLSATVQQCVSMQDFDRLRRRLNNAIEDIQIRVTEDKLSEELKRTIQASIDISDAKFASKMDIDSFQDSLDALTEKLETSANEITDLIDSKVNSVRGDIGRLTNELKSKPWERKIKEIRSEVNEKAERGDFYDLKHSVEKNIEEFSCNIKDFSRKVQNFADILERFDEIVLDKASKDDVNLITGQLPLFSHKKEFAEHIQNFTVTIASLQDSIQKLEDFSTNANASHANLVQKFEILKRENYEASLINKNIQTLRENMQHKADKIDIYQVYDLMSRRDDVLNLREDNELIRKQLEMAVMIVTELSRTLLRAGETPSVLLKQRTDLYKNSENLMAWLTKQNHFPVPETELIEKPRRARTTKPTTLPIRGLLTPKPHKRDSI